MNRKVAVALLIAVVLLAYIIAAFAFPIGVLESAHDPNNFFSIMQISNTQYLAANDSGLFSGLTSWIASSVQSFNLKMVVHTGDIVDNSSDSAQWERANDSMSVLLNAGVPYCWAAGSHDTFLQDSTDEWMGNSYVAFNPQVMISKPYWVGSLMDGRDTAVKLFIGKYSFLVINLEYQPTAAELDWMTSLITAHKDSNVIVATNSYLNNQGTYDLGSETELFNTLNQYPTVFLTLSGHVYPNGTYQTRVGNREEILFDRQDADDGTGAAAARIMTFGLKEQTVFVNTYATYGQSGFLNGTANQFSFSVNLKTDPSLQGPPYWAIGVLVFAACITGLATIFVKPKNKQRFQKQAGA